MWQILEFFLHALYHEGICCCIETRKQYLDNLDLYEKREKFLDLLPQCHHSNALLQLVAKIVTFLYELLE